ncbi:OLC1v1026604C2 [Oldenlandia corymbosa var. corymbosa]|nr:OLC1v1026604C2 [Oldenlandia corymbosa var. corymbosa]
MPDVLLRGGQQNDPSSKPGKTTKPNSHNLPFSKPLGYGNFPPTGGVPFANLEPDSPSKTLDLDGISVSFATLEELELGTVTTINENVYGGSIYGSSLIGKAQGMYVASSEDGNSHMMAMTACFIRNEDCLRFFGVHRTDVNHESHVAVIGGSGKYQNANGYATIKTVDVSSSYAEKKHSNNMYKLLLFNVYLG